MMLTFIFRLFVFIKHQRWFLFLP
eukprot:COSAG06_NODE_1421_length_9512_cov_3.328482_5_plen_23_part_01